MAKDEQTHLGWRLVWAVVGAGLTFVVLSTSFPDLQPPVVFGASIAAGIAVGLVGPMLLDLLSLA